MLIGTRPYARPSSPADLPPRQGGRCGGAGQEEVKSSRQRVRKAGQATAKVAAIRRLDVSLRLTEINTLPSSSIIQLSRRPLLPIPSSIPFPESALRARLPSRRAPFHPFPPRQMAAADSGAAPSQARPPPRFTTALAAGAFAGFAVDVSLFPLDTLKTRAQSSQGFWAAGGFRGVYNGISSVAAGSAPGGESGT